MCTAHVSNGGDRITKENINKKLCQRNLPGLSIKLTTPNQTMSYIYRSHVLRGRQCSYQIPCGASAKGRWELSVDSKTTQTDCSSETNWLIMKGYKKHWKHQAWKTSKLQWMKPFEFYLHVLRLLLAFFLGLVIQKGATTELPQSRHQEIEMVCLSII